jgi:protein-disulfide isomerase
MANPSGNRKSNSRRKRTGTQQTARQTQQKAAQAKQPVTVSTEPVRPVSRRSSKKEAAQAQAKKKQQMQLIIGGVALAVIAAVVIIFLNRPSGSGVQIDYSGLEVSQSQVVASEGTPVASPDASQPLSWATGVTVGDPGAPVTMHIFSDFQCHFCLQFHDETLPLIVEDFVRSGQVKLVYHDFPRLGTDPSVADPNNLEVEMRDGNNESSLASQAALCASEQDKYLEMSDKLFGNYGGVQQGAFDRANLNRFAEDLDLDMDAFNACMDSGRYVPVLADSVAQGQGQGITATPMFILDNGNGAPNLIRAD